MKCYIQRKYVNIASGYFLLLLWSYWRDSFGNLIVLSILDSLTTCIFQRLITADFHQKLTSYQKLTTFSKIFYSWLSAIFIKKLPIFSANYYLTNQREEGDLYSEEYTNVAVLFASIPDYMDSFRWKNWLVSLGST